MNLGFRGTMIASLAAFLGSALASDGVVRVRLGDDAFDIPNRYIVHERPFWMRFVPGLAPGNAVLLEVSAAEVAARVSGYRTHDGGIETTLSVVVEKLDAHELSGYLDPAMHVYSDVWYGREYLGDGRYREVPDDWVVERHESGFYKVRRRGDDLFWTAVRIPPRSREHMPTNPFDFLLASAARARRRPIWLRVPMTRAQRG